MITIANDEDHAAAMKRIDALMSAASGSPEADELEALVAAVQKYEEVRFPIAEPTPEAAAEFRAEQEAASIRPSLSARK